MGFIAVNIPDVTKVIKTLTRLVNHSRLDTDPVCSSSQVVGCRLPWYGTISSCWYNSSRGSEVSCSSCKRNVMCHFRLSSFFTIFSIQWFNAVVQWGCPAFEQTCYIHCRGFLMDNSAWAAVTFKNVRWSNQNESMIASTCCYHAVAKCNVCYSNSFGPSVALLRILNWLNAQLQSYSPGGANVPSLPLNHPCTAAMQPDVTLLWPLIKSISRVLQSLRIPSIWPVSYTHLTLPTNREV